MPADPDRRSVGSPAESIPSKLSAMGAPGMIAVGVRVFGVVVRFKHTQAIRSAALARQPQAVGSVVRNLMSISSRITPWQARRARCACYLSCKLVPLDPVPCLIKHGLSDADAISLSLIENVHRADMHPIDKAKALQALLAKYGSYDAVAKESACSVSTIRRYLKLLELPAVLQDRIGTADGSSGISALSRLASTFTGEDWVARRRELAAVVWTAPRGN